MNELIKKQLDKVEIADLSNFNIDTNTYFIPRKVDIKLNEDSCYIIHLKPSCYKNDTVKINWNDNKSYPEQEFLKVDVAKNMNKMVKVVGIAYDYMNRKDLNFFWSGWLNINDIEVIEKL